MKDIFKAWYPISADERKKFVSHGFIVIDTNVLLTLYRMSASVRDDVMALLSQLGTRLWIPHQVGLEFHKNRLGVIFEQEQTDRVLRKSIAEAHHLLDAATRDMRDHPVIDRAEFSTVIGRAFDGITGYLDKVTAKPYLSLTAALEEDPILDSVSELLRDKVGPPYRDDALAVIKEQADHRYQLKQPPGYSDSQKEGDGKYGDYIIWRQILDEAAVRKLPVLFVTNDQKEDWYQRMHGRTVGPRVELICEMHEVSQMPFHMQTLAMFIKTAPSSLGESVHDNTVSEIDRLGMQSAQTYSASKNEAVRELISRGLRNDNMPLALRRRLANLEAEINEILRDIRSTKELGDAAAIDAKRILLGNLRSEYTMLRTELDTLDSNEALRHRLAYQLSTESEKDASAIAERSVQFRPGELISHDLYGPGRILQINSYGNIDGNFAIVDFGQEYGVRQLHLSYAPIHKI